MHYTRCVRSEPPGSTRKPRNLRLSTRGNATSELRSPDEWKTLYAAAMLESDGPQLRQSVEKADAAIQARLTELTESSSLQSEKMELQSALQYLRRLRVSLTTG